MGVELTHLLLPVPRSHTPSPVELARLIGRLVEAGFLLSSRSPRLPYTLLEQWSLASATGCYIQFSRTEGHSFPCPPSEDDLAAVVDRDFMLVWPVESLEASDLRYPLTIVPDFLNPVDIYYEIELQLGHEYIYNTSEVIQPFAPEVCTTCGASLRVPSAVTDEDVLFSDGESLFAFQLYRHCPACGTEFRPEDRTALIGDYRTDRRRSVTGGATSHFALSVECGKCWEYDAVPTDEFLTACEDALNCHLEHIVDCSP